MQIVILSPELFFFCCITSLKRILIWNRKSKLEAKESRGGISWKALGKQIKAEGWEETTTCTVGSRAAGRCLILPKKWVPLTWEECHWLWHRWVGQSFSSFLSLFPSSLSLLFFWVPNKNKMLQSLVYRSDSEQENILKSQKVLQDGKTISQTGLAMSSRTVKQLWSKTAPQSNPFWLSPVKWVFSKYYIMTSLNPTKLFPQEITLSQLDSNYLLYLMTP